MPTTLKDEAAIVGIGQTKYSKNSGVSELSLACEAVRNAIRDAGLSPVRHRRPHHLHDGHQRRDRRRARRRHGRLPPVQPHPVRRRRRDQHRAPGRDGARDGHLQVRGRLPRAERPLRPALQPGRLGQHRHQRPDPLELVHAVGAAHAGELGGDVHAALHARVRRDGARPRAGGDHDAQPRRDQPGRDLLPAPAQRSRLHEREVDLRAAALVRLLPGERRRLGGGDHHARARARPARRSRR